MDINDGVDTITEFANVARLVTSFIVRVPLLNVII